MQTINEYIDSQRDRYLNELKDLIRIPSISAQAKHKQDIDQCANHLVEHFKKIGMGKVELIKTNGNPLVYSEWLKAAGKPTVLIYGHYDVQPEDPVNEWHTPPFEATVKGDELFGRGTADDKGQFWIHVKAVEALLKQNGKLPVNVKFIIEGEEETSGASIEAFIPKNLEKLKCDVVMVSDSAMFAKNLPTVCASLRGIIYTQIDFQGPSQDLHSGSYGGAVTNPANALAKVISQLHDERGRVTVPGFYDDVREQTDKEKKMVAQLPFNEKQYMSELGIDALSGEKGYSTLQRTSVRPTLDVNGMCSGYIQEGAKTIIPAKAMAKISMRMVPNQNPEKIYAAYEKHVKSLTPPGVKLTIKKFAASGPYIADIEGKPMRSAIAALKRAFGKEPLFTGEGGSIPIVGTFKRELGVDTILMGIGTPDENIHSPNEKLYLPHFYKGILASAYFLEELSKS